MVKASFERKKAAGKEALGSRYKAAKDKCMDIYEEENGRLKGVYIKAVGRQMNSLKRKCIGM